VIYRVQMLSRDDYNRHMRQLKLPESLKIVFTFIVGFITFAVIGAVCAGAYLVLRVGALR